MNLDIRSSRWNLANHLSQYIWFAIHKLRPTIYYDMYGLLYTYSEANHLLWYVWFAIHIQWGQPFITICMVCYTHTVRPTIYYDMYGLLYTYSEANHLLRYVWFAIHIKWQSFFKSHFIVNVHLWSYDKVLTAAATSVCVNSNSYSRSIIGNVQYCDSWTRSYNCIHFPVL